MMSRPDLNCKSSEKASDNSDPDGERPSQVHAP
jgi:hypothetical protein